MVGSPSEQKNVLLYRNNRYSANKNCESGNSTALRPKIVEDRPLGLGYIGCRFNVL